ncbi:hypothetical protein ACFP3Q_14500 [Nocardioides sp. GCM10027113]|uniref:hypothetical protein n=1 Tax=unclassified Nocardioides TaxID=2615069 RepID=UPI00361FAA25
MTSDAYCEHCDLPLATCVHGAPPPPPPAPAAKPAKKATPRRTASAGTATTRRTSSEPKVSVRRTGRTRTPQAELRPHILAVLQEYGGRARGDDVLTELEVRLDDVLLDGDREKAPTGDVRWRLNARRERKAMTDEGLMVPPREPGVWELSAEGRAASYE